jgi:hypothetical protein
MLEETSQAKQSLLLQGKLMLCGVLHTHMYRNRQWRDVHILNEEHILLGRFSHIWLRTEVLLKCK